MNLIIPVEIIKFSLGLFFLIILAYYDITEGKIPNKILIFMLIIGFVFIYLDKEFLKIILITFLFVFTFSYLLWEFSLLTPGDVKLLSILTFYLPYSFIINPYSFLAAILFLVMFLFSIVTLFKNYNRKILKKALKDYIYYLKNLNYFKLIIFLFFVIQVLNVLNFGTLESLLIIFLIIFITDYITKLLDLELTLFLLILNLILIYYQLNFRSLDLFSLISQLIFSLLFFVTLRTFFVIFFYYLSTKEKKVEDLKIGDKLALLPVKFNKETLIYPLNYNLVIHKSIQENILFNYNPTLGIEKENINKIKRFFKRKGFLKVKVIEELPFVPFLLVSFVLFYLYYFYTYFF